MLQVRPAHGLPPQKMQRQTCCELRQSVLDFAHAPKPEKVVTWSELRSGMPFRWDQQDAERLSCIIFSNPSTPFLYTLFLYTLSLSLSFSMFDSTILSLSLFSIFYLLYSIFYFLSLFSLSLSFSPLLFSCKFPIHALGFSEAQAGPGCTCQPAGPHQHTCIESANLRWLCQRLIPMIFACSTSTPELISRIAGHWRPVQGALGWCI